MAVELIERQAVLAMLEEMAGKLNSAPPAERATPLTKGMRMALGSVADRVKSLPVTALRAPQSTKVVSVSVHCEYPACACESGECKFWREA